MRQSNKLARDPSRARVTRASKGREKHQRRRQTALQPASIQPERRLTPGPQSPILASLDRERVATRAPPKGHHPKTLRQKDRSRGLPRASATVQTLESGHGTMPAAHRRGRRSRPQQATTALSLRYQGQRGIDACGQPAAVPPLYIGILTCRSAQGLP